MIELKHYNYENRLGRCTSRDEYGNADVKGVDMSFMLGLPYEEMAILAQALNRLADFEDAEIAEDKKLREKSNKKMNDDLISRQAAISFIENVPYIKSHQNMGGLIKEWLEQIPTVQPEQKTGYWIGEELGECSNCGHSGCASDIWNGCEQMFCPNCGAKMESDNND